MFWNVSATSVMLGPVVHALKQRSGDPLPARCQSDTSATCLTCRPLWDLVYDERNNRSLSGKTNTSNGRTLTRTDVVPCWSTLQLSHRLQVLTQYWIDSEPFCLHQSLRPREMRNMAQV